jgi:exopolysaccharide production protein ExoQ
LATAQRLLPATISEHVSRGGSPGRRARNDLGPRFDMGSAAAAALFCLAGVSPFVNEPTAMRAVATSSAGGVHGAPQQAVDLCGLLDLCRSAAPSSVCRLSMHMKLVTCFPILAFLLFPVSQQPTRTISSAALLMGGVLLLYYIMSRYTLDQVLELLLVLGTVTMVASVVFALALPQYGLDLKGGHETAWKGIFSAKNYLGNVALFFLTAAVSYRARNSFLRSLRLSQICLCLAAIAFSRAATAYMLTAVYVVYFAIMKTLHRFRKTDYLVVGMLLLAAVSTARR